MTVNVRYALPIAILIAESVALVCQFIQHTDPTFPLAYFTVCSGLLAGGVAAASLLGRAQQRLFQLKFASTVAVVFSAAVFATVIAPASPTGSWVQPYDDYWVRAATVLFHAVAPILVTADFLAVRPPLMKKTQILAYSCTWPVVYAIILFGSSALTSGSNPYPFLDVAEVGLRAALFHLALAGAILFVIGYLLHTLSTRVHQKRGFQVE